MRRIKTILAAAIISMVLCANAFADGGYVVKGVVVDQQGPVIGASVLEQGTQNGTVTDLDGNYTLNVASASSVVEISCMGYSTVTLKASEVPATLILQEDNEFLEEAVVIGYGTVRKSDMTGSVAAVKANQLNKGISASPTSLLQGKSAGVVVTSGDGAVGSASTIRIRGGSSLKANNNPLIVIDGLPISEVGISGVSDGLASVNPNDVESFTVLKDASATAIYGSRASNGVIIITTKKGHKGAARPHVSFDVQYSLSQNTKYVEMMTGDEMRAAMAQYKGTDSEAYKALGTANTDWQKEIYRLGQSVDGNVGIDGSLALGNAGYMPYRASLGYTLQNGTLKKNQLGRLSSTVNLTPTLLDEHLKIDLNGKFMRMNNDFSNTGAIGAAVEYDPTQPVYYKDYGGAHPYAMEDINGYRVWSSSDGSNFNTQSSQNPLSLIEDKTNTSTANRFIGNAQFDYKIHGYEALRLNVNLGLDASKSDGVVTVPVGTEQTAHSQTQAGDGLNEIYSQKKLDETLEMYADWTPELGGKHFLDVMGGYSWQHFYNETYDLQQTAVSSPKTLYERTFKTEYFLVSFFGRVNYSYSDKYLLTATVRYDGTSRFLNNKWGLFPSVAASWNVKNEDFLKGSDAVSALKLRLSWGQTGQQDLQSGDYPTLASYYYNGDGMHYLFGGQEVTPILPQAYNAELKWETTTTYNAGLDFGFLDGRIYGSVDAYIRYTKDLLNWTPVAAGANLSNYLNANIGNLENKGIELDMNFIALEKRDLSWIIGVNGAYNTNKITKLTTNDSASDYHGVETGGISGGTGNTIQCHMTGHPASSFYVYEQIYDEDGNPVPDAYVDQNGDGVIDTDNDLIYYHDPAPKFTLGFNTSFSWKTWTLAASGHGSYGNWVYNNNASRLSLLTDMWTNNFVSNRIKGAYELGFNNAAYFSSYFVQDASFFKFDNITVSKLINLSEALNLSVYGTVQNVATITKYDGVDPEVFSGIDNQLYPRPRTYILGIKFNF